MDERDREVYARVVDAVTGLHAAVVTITSAVQELARGVTLLTAAVARLEGRLDAPAE